MKTPSSPHDQLPSAPASMAVGVMGSIIVGLVILAVVLARAPRPGPVASPTATRQVAAITAGVPSPLASEIGHSKGNPAAKVVLIEYGDFQ